MFVAEMLRHGQSAAFLQVGQRGEESRVGRVAFRRRGQIDGGVGEGNPGFGESDEFAGLLRGHRDEEAARVGQPDVLAGRDDQAPGDETDVLAGMEHLGQPVKRGIGIAAADAFDESAYRVIVGIVIGIVDHGLALDAFLDDRAGQVDGARFVRSGGQGGEFQRIKAAAGVAIADFREVGGGVRMEGDVPPAESAFRVGEGAVHESAQIHDGERTQLEDQRAGDQRAVDVEKRVHRGGPDEAHCAAFDVGQEDVLLRFVEAVDFVDEQNGARSVA